MILVESLSHYMGLIPLLRVEELADRRQGQNNIMKRFELTDVPSTPTLDAFPKLSSKRLGKGRIDLTMNQ